jgi:hypothetical protein
MLRQVGLAMGVSVFVAVVGAPKEPQAALTAWQHGWTVIALIGALAAVVGAVGLRRRSTGAESIAPRGDSPVAPGIPASLAAD